MWGWVPWKQSQTEINVLRVLSEPTLGKGREGRRKQGWVEAEAGLQCRLNLQGAAELK